MLASYEKEIRALKDDAMRMTWYMRGGMQYSDILALSPDEREIVSKIVKDNIATTEKTRLPFF